MEYNKWHKKLEQISKQNHTTKKLNWWSDNKQLQNGKIFELQVFQTQKFFEEKN